MVRAGFSPLKGARHLALPTVELDLHGAVGDRRFCVVDVGAAQVLRTVQHPQLTSVHAETRHGALTLRLPDGRTASGVPVPSGHEVVADYWGRPTRLSVLEGPHAALLSDHLGREVALTLAPPGAVIYGAGISLVTQASLDELAARTGTAVDPARFRATLVLDAGEPAGAEDDWNGRELRLGSAVIRTGGPIGRCAVIDIDPATGGRGSGLLRELATYRPRNAVGEPCFGIYADVVVPGIITATPEPDSQRA